jgi:DEAD/DEAH box helicase domain-containing protein
MEKLIEITRDMVKNCECFNGCPSCIYSPKCGNDNKPLNKLGTIFILESIKKLMKSKEISNVIPKNIVTNSQNINKPPKISLSTDAYQEFESPDKLIKKGESFYNNGNLNEALICFQDALKLDKKNLKALKFQGMIFELEEKHAEAIRSFQMALEIESNNEETLYYLAVSFYNTDKCQESKEISQKLIKLRSDWDDAWYVLGISLESLGDEKGAIQAYSKALAINPLNEDAGENLKDLLNN